MTKLPSLQKILDAVPKRAAIIGLVVVAVLGGCFYGLSAFVEQAETENRSAQQDVNQLEAEALSGRLGTVLEPHRKILQELAQKSNVIASLSEDKATRDSIAAAEQANIPDALLLRLLPRGGDHTDPESVPPLTFASVDMLQNAANNQDEIRAELHLSGTDKEHIVLIQRVPAAGDSVGFLHLSLNPEVMRTAVRGVTVKRGMLEVRQPVPKGAPLIIAKSGKDPNSDLPAAIAGIVGTRWVVSYRTAATRGALGSAFDMLPRVAAAVVVALLLIALGMSLRSRRKNAVVSSDVTYQGAIKAILEGAHPGLEQLLPGGAGAAAAFDTASAGIDGDDITTIAAEPTQAEQTSPMPDLFASGIEVKEEAEAEADIQIDASIFRSYDIRGVVGETLTIEGVYQIGRALGSEAIARGQQTVVTARDGRNSSQELRDALIEGLRDSGRDVLDIGLTPTPVLYFATHYLDTHSGVMITGSHNPPEYNGLKIVLDGETLSGDAIQAIRSRIENNDFTSGEGTMQSMEIIHDYIRRISEEIPVSLGDALKVVVDCANSVPGIVAPHILRAIGHDVVELYCDVDGNFPNHYPDPSDPNNLKDLIQAVDDEDADLGLAFDGDGDRLGVVDASGNIIWADRQLMLFARDVLSRNPGAKVIYDVKCSSLLAEEITKHGGEAIMARSGHSLIKSKMQETGALLAGEMSGHIFFKERWYGFDDALYSAARLLEILVNAEASPEEVFSDLPGGVATPELRLDMTEDKHVEFMLQVLDAANFDDGEISTIDGLRVDFPDSWGLIRASNTTPCLVLRFEGNDEAALNNVQNRFRDLLLGIDGNLSLPF